MILVNFKGCTVTDDIRLMIETFYVGGIMLSAQNIEGKTQLPDLL